MKIKTQIGISFDVYDTSDENNLIATYDTLERAIEHAKQNENYCVDMMLDLQNPENGISLPESEDYIFSMKVYPECQMYENIDTNPTLIIQKN